MFKVAMFQDISSTAFCMKSTVISVEDGGDTLLQNVELSANYLAFQPVRLFLLATV
jgi:hypothetical protein